MYRRNRERGIYLATCKDNDELYTERMELDLPYVLRMLARAQGTINANEPPPKLHEDPNHKMAFKCGWCRHKGICHEGDKPRRNCRTCLYSSPEAGVRGAARSGTNRWSVDEQAVGCSSHLLLPGLVDGEQIDCDEENNTVSYRMRSGAVWVDGKIRWGRRREDRGVLRKA